MLFKNINKNIEVACFEPQRSIQKIKNEFEKLQKN